MDKLRTTTTKFASMIFVVAAALFVGVPHASAIVNGSAVLGQNAGGSPLWTSSVANRLETTSPNAQGLYYPSDAVADSVNHRLFVSDPQNYRVLVFGLTASDSLSDHDADVVLGQSSMSANVSPSVTSASFQPQALAYDVGHSLLFVSDQNASRILVFDLSGGITNGMPATYVLGAPDFTTSGGGTSSVSFNGSVGLSYDAAGSRLFSSDKYQNRILVWDLSGGITNGMAASYVLGQFTFTTTTSGVTQSSVSYPGGVAFDSFNSALYVADTSANRVLQFDLSGGITNGMNAAHVLGQADFTSSSAGTTQTTLRQPSGVTANGAGKVFVTDQYNQRVMIYDIASITEPQSAVNVFGQALFTTATSAVTAAGLYYPVASTVDAANNKLFVVDSYAQRVKVYDIASISDNQAAIDVVGQVLNGVPVYTTSGVNNTSNIQTGVSANGLSSPEDIVMDTSGNRLFLADRGNNRVLMYPLNASDGFSPSSTSATLVLGQTSFSVAASAGGDIGLTGPSGLAFDRTNNRLFVADTGNNRVMVFNLTGITDGASASYVIGQTSSVSYAAATTKRGLSAPSGLAYDSTGNRLFVADTGNNRVMVFDVSPANLASDGNGTDALAVVGQSDFTSSVAATTQSGLSGPSGVAYDPNTSRLFIADTTNNRVMVYDASGGITDGMDAQAALGQYDFTSSGAATTQDRLSAPRRLSFVPGNAYLWVADTGNSRSMAYDLSSGVATGMLAVFTNTYDDFTTLSASTQQFVLNYPRAIAFSGNPSNSLWVADTQNNRAVFFPLMRINATSFANVTVGDSVNILPDFTTAGGTSCALYGIASGSLPPGIAFTSSTPEYISGTPRQAGTYSFTLRIATCPGQNGSVYAEKSFTWTVLPRTARRATGVIGQNDDAGNPSFFEGNIPDDVPNASTIGGATAVAVDAVHHRMFVADRYTGALLEYDLSSSNVLVDKKADHILGNPAPFPFKDRVSMSSQHVMQSTPNYIDSIYDLQYDPVSNYLFVGYVYGIFVFDVSTITDNQPAIRTLGKADYMFMNDHVPGRSFVDARYLALDVTGRRLFAADSIRVVVFDISDIVNGEPAQYVIGQPNFTSLLSGTTQTRFNTVNDIAYDLTNQRLFVSDEFNRRVLVFDVRPAGSAPADICSNGTSTTGIANNMNASCVLGQTNFTSNTSKTFPNGMSTAEGIAFDSTNNRLFVSDRNADKIWVWDFNAVPIVNGATMSYYLGCGGSTSQCSLDDPLWHVTYDDSSQRLYVPDGANFRTMVFDVASITNGENAVDVLGQTDGKGNPDYTHIGLGDVPNAHGLNFQYGGSVAIDSVRHRMFVSDAGNFRILEFNLDSDNQLIDRYADYVIGQADFRSRSQAMNQTQFTTPGVLAYDSTHDRLFLANPSANRILIFDTRAAGSDPVDICSNGTSTTGIANGMNASCVLGQTSFTATGSGRLQNKMNSPGDIAYDTSTSRLFVVDQNNYRVLSFDLSGAITDGMNASHVIGQTDFTTNQVSRGRFGDCTPMNQNILCSPSAVVPDSASGKLYIMDGTPRVLEYDISGGITDGMAASSVLGQSSFTASGASLTQSGLVAAGTLALDSDNHELFVLNGYRISVFDVASISNGGNAIGVIGQNTFTSNSGGSSDTIFSLSGGALTYDPSSRRLFAVDRGNHRVVVFGEPEITTTSLPDANQGVAYDEQFTTIGMQGSVSYSLVSGELPPGLAVGSLTGTPTQSGTYTFTIRSSDAVGSAGAVWDDQTYTITVAAPGAVVLPPPPAPVPTPPSTPVPTTSPPPVPTSAPPPGEGPGEGAGGSGGAGGGGGGGGGAVIPISTPSPSQSPGVLPEILPEARIIIEKVRGVTEPVARPTAIAVTTVSLVSVIAITFMVTDGADLVSILFLLFQTLFEMLGLKKRTKVWGTVYDAVTKHPLPFTKVQLLDAANRVLETRFADRDGRYGFLTSPQSLHQQSIQIKMVASRNGYSFPSRSLAAGMTDFVVYQRIYTGGVVTADVSELVHFDIPLDPIARTPGLYSRIPGTALHGFIVWFLDISFWVGLVVLPFNAIIHPSPATIGMLIAFLLANGIRVISGLVRPYGIVKDQFNGRTVPFALITLNDQTGKRISFAVSDERGRYFLAVESGAYELAAYTPAAIVPPRQIHGSITSRHGWITRELKL